MNYVIWKWLLKQLETIISRISGKYIHILKARHILSSEKGSVTIDKESHLGVTCIFKCFTPPFFIFETRHISFSEVALISESSISQTQSEYKLVTRMKVEHREYSQ